MFYVSDISWRFSNFNVCFPVTFSLLILKKKQDEFVEPVTLVLTLIAPPSFGYIMCEWQYVFVLDPGDVTHENKSLIKSS